MADERNDLAGKRCRPCTGDVPPLSSSEITRMLSKLSGWEYRDGRITKTFHLPNYWHTMAFVNASAWISHREDHHPEIVVGYNECRVDYWTHAVNGISENDFICAAKLDALFAL